LTSKPVTEEIMDVAIIADDLTGAADSGVQLARSGYRTAVAFRGVSIPPAEDLDAVAIDTDSRPLPAGFAAERVLEAGHAARDAHVVYKKIDSTLRGQIPAELAVALEATGREKAIVAPAFPSAGRTTRDGVLLVHDEPVHETDLAYDPRTPVREGHIPTLLAESSFSVSTLSIEEVGDSEPIRQAFANSQCVVADATSDADLAALVRAVPEPSAVLWVGSAGLARAFGKVYSGPRAGVAFEPGVPASGVLAVVGSVNEVAREQLRHLAEEPGVEQVALDTAALVNASCEEALGETTEAVRAALSGNRGAILYSATGEEVDSALRGGTVSESGISESVADALAKIVARLSGDDLFDALVLTGGDTAVRVAGELGATGILLKGELETGVPIGDLVGPRPYRVITKAGGFGGPNTLRDAFHALVDPRKGKT
jgi:uncharacterized protein YgbK (DUF1537 family)